MVQWVIGSILHGVDPLSYFSFQPVLHDWCNKSCGMCYPLCWMVHIIISIPIILPLLRLYELKLCKYPYDRSILHGVDPMSYFSFQPVLHEWCNKSCGMCYPLCWMVHIKEPLLLIGKSSLCGGSGFPLSLSEWSLTICLTPYNHK